MTAQRPTLVFVHGAWHGPWCWDRLRAELGEFTSTAVSLPSSGPDPSALGDFSDDVAAIRAAVSAVDGPAVVVAHSYGGAPVTEAACGLENVAGVIYIAAFVLDIGQPAAAVAAGGGVPEWWDVHFDEGYADALRGEEVFFGDLPAADAANYAAQLTHQSLASGAAPLTDAVWKYVPTSYVICEFDATTPPAAQDEMAQRTGRVHHLATGHSPFLSQPAELAALIRADVADFAETLIVDS
jgi:pimeloyl-ACP methyl ester carboxylesterase